MSGRRKCLFKDALNTFYLQLYGIRHMVNELSDSKRGNPLPLYRLLFPISSKGSFICIIPQTGYHIPQHLLHQSWSTGWMRNSSMGPPWRTDLMTHHTMSKRSCHRAKSCSDNVRCHLICVQIQWDWPCMRTFSTLLMTVTSSNISVAESVTLVSGS